VTISGSTGILFSHDVHPYTPNQDDAYELLTRAEDLSSAPLPIGTVSAHYRVNGGVFNAITMVANGEPDEFACQIPAQLRPSVVEYYFEAEDDQGGLCTYPRNAPDSCHHFRVDDDFSDTMERSSAWRVGDVDDDALTGAWQRADPVGTIYEANQVQPEDDHTVFPGTHCFVTGNGVVGGTAGAMDVDAGKTTLHSPVFDLRGGSAISISYWRWYTNNLGFNPNEDYWSVSISNDAGMTWSIVEYSTLASKSVWQQVSLQLDEYFDSPGLVQMRFVAEDLGGGSLVEAAVDDFTLLGIFDMTSVDPVDGPAAGFDLSQNYPNPFNPSTEIRFALRQPGPVRLAVFDTSGRLIKVLADGSFGAGEHRVFWAGSDANGSPVASGFYLYRLAIPDGGLTRRMLLLK